MSLAKRPAVSTAVRDTGERRPNFYITSRDLNFDLYTCSASLLSMEASPKSHRLVYFETRSLTGVCMADWPANPKDPPASATLQAFPFYVGSGN